MIAEEINYELLKQYVDTKLHLLNRNTTQESIKKAISKYISNTIVMNKLSYEEYLSIVNKTFIMYCDLYTDTITKE